MNRLHGTIIVTLSALVAVGCGHDAPPSGLAVTTAASVVIPGARRALGVEMLFDAISVEVPSFAGVIVDPKSEGRGMIVFVADPADSVRAIATLRAQLPRQRPAPDVVQVQFVNYSFRTLAAWRDSLLVRAATYLSRVDRDEASNAIDLGVLDANGLQFVAVTAKELGVPDGAWRASVVPRGSVRTDLKDRVRPVNGGLEFTRNPSPSACTVGINGEWSYSSSYRGFLTASHCTRTYMKLDVGGTNFYQDSVVTPANLVGTEWDDPLYFTGGVCPAGNRCRYSDAAFVRYGSAATSGLGTISRTSWRS